MVCKCNYHINILWKLNYYRKYINKYQKNQEKYIQKYNFRKKYSYLPYIWANTENICITLKMSISWKQCKKKFFLMPLHQTDINGFKSDLYLLLYGPLEPMVINFTCDLSLVCIPPRWSPPEYGPSGDFFWIRTTKSCANWSVESPVSTPLHI